MPLLTFKLNEENLKDFGRRFRAGKQRQLVRAVSNMRREFYAEMVRQQQTRGDGDWPGWSTHRPKGGESYADRRIREAFNPPAGVQYFSLLKRTGRLMEGYLRGIRPDYENFKVIIPFPRGKDGTTTVARVHQGELEQPIGSMGPRPFNLQRFKDIGIDILTKAVKSNPKDGPYKGYNQ